MYGLTERPSIRTRGGGGIDEGVPAPSGPGVENNLGVRNGAGGVRRSKKKRWTRCNAGSVGGGFGPLGAGGGGPADDTMRLSEGVMCLTGCPGGLGLCGVDRNWSLVPHRWNTSHHRPRTRTSRKWSGPGIRSGRTPARDVVLGSRWGRLRRLMRHSPGGEAGRVSPVPRRAWGGRHPRRLTLRPGPRNVDTAEGCWDSSSPDALLLCPEVSEVDRGRFPEEKVIGRGAARTVLRTGYRVEGCLGGPRSGLGTVLSRR